jgi:hypothetical protein
LKGLGLKLGVEMSGVEMSFNPNHSLEHNPTQGSNLTPIFGDLSQSEKLSEIKQPLDKL